MHTSMCSADYLITSTSCRVQIPQTMLIICTLLRQVILGVCLQFDICSGDLLPGCWSIHSAWSACNSVPSSACRQHVGHSCSHILHSCRRCAACSTSHTVIAHMHITHVSSWVTCTKQTLTTYIPNGYLLYPPGAETRCTTTIKLNQASERRDTR